MEAKCISKFQRYGSRKVSQVLDQIRGKDVKTATSILPLIPRRAAEVVQKVVHSAASNLQVKLGNKLDFNKIYIVEAFSDQGPMKHLKRFHAGPQGRAMPYKKSSCHLTVVVSDEKRVKKVSKAKLKRAKAYAEKKATVKKPVAKKPATKKEGDK
ncbi:MAG: 50S ribosomal protein L22 [Elusimicrobiaceae bacterium]|nr:50S ribosomal protein L22 [Elusimicrobiaceae bacterium]